MNKRPENEVICSFNFKIEENQQTRDAVLRIRRNHQNRYLVERTNFFGDYSYHVDSFVTVDDAYKTYNEYMITQALPNARR